MRVHNFSFFFFFQAEDGIRDYKVTGVQTCALPISRLPGLAVDPVTVQTNIVIFGVQRPGEVGASQAATSELVAQCAARKVKIHAIGPTSIRCVTHKDIDAEDVERALEAFGEITSRW